MALPEEMNTEQTMRRSDKILEAKSSFDTGFHREIRQKRENGVNPKEGHPFGMDRMLIAGMLFLLLVMAFHFQVSIGSYNKETVKQLLNNDSHWQIVVDQITAVMKNIHLDDNPK